MLICHASNTSTGGITRRSLDVRFDVIVQKLQVGAEELTLTFLLTEI